MTNESCANELVNRILALIPDNPQIMELEDAWGLFRVPGFRYGDLDPLVARPNWALAEAKRLYNAGHLAKGAER